MQIDAGKPRVRTKDRRTSSTRYHHSVVGDVTTSGTNVRDGGMYEQMSDIVIPRFRERSQEGEVLINRMSSVRAVMTGEQLQECKLEQPPNSSQFGRYYAGWSRFCTGWGTSLGDYWTSGMRYNLIPPAEAHNLAIEACTRARSNIGRSNTDMWENLAESDKTMQLLRSPLASWFKFEKKARIVTAGLSAAQAWLVYRYGIKPLVSSVNDVLENLRKGARTNNRETSRGTAATSRSLSDSFVTTNTYWSTAYMTVERQRTETLAVRAMSIDTIISENQYTYGLSTKSLLTLPWELIPYSFVVDWFSNVGDFVGAIAQSFYPASLGQCHTFQTTFSEYRNVVSTTSFSPSTVAVKTPFGGWSRADVVWKDRYPGLLGPGLVIKQDFKFDSYTRIADSLALVGQQVMRAMVGRK